MTTHHTCRPASGPLNEQQTPIISADETKPVPNEAIASIDDLWQHKGANSASSLRPASPQGRHHRHQHTVIAADESLVEEVERVLAFDSSDILPVHAPPAAQAHAATDTGPCVPGFRQVHTLPLARAPTFTN